MKKLFITLILFLAIVTGMASSQVVVQSALATKKFIFNSGSLVSQGVEQLTPVSDSSCGHFSYSLKTMVTFENVYYHVYYGTIQGPKTKVYLRKSSDGVNWSAPVRVGNAAPDKNEYYANIHVWRKGANINVGVMYIDFTTSNPQVKYSLSTNGGSAFQTPIPVSSHTDNTQINLGGMAGRGDTIMMNWTRQYSGDRIDQTWFSRTTNGGINWTPMAVAFPGNHYSTECDIAMDSLGNVWSITADDQFQKVNPVIRFSSNLGATWETRTQIVSFPSFNLCTDNQLQVFNGKVYCIWTHAASFTDSIVFSVSTNGGSNWRSRKISDTDTISATGFPSWKPTHPSFTISLNNIIYAAWVNSKERHSTILDSAKYNVYLSRSTDDGVTWGASVKVNGPSNFSRVFNAYPVVTARSSGANDTVLVTWVKYRNIFGTQGITQIGTETPQNYSLSQNYPNPFNPVTNITVNIARTGFANLTVYDITGRVAAILFNSNIRSGAYKIDFDASLLPSGVYFYRLNADGFSDTKKMILVK